MVEDFKIIERVIHILKNVPSSNKLKYLGDELNTLNLKYVYDKGANFSENKENYNRIMIRPFIRNSNIPCPSMVFGLVGNEYKLISMTPIPPINNKPISYITRVVEDNKDKVKIYNSDEGTTITLYWSKNQWIISTHRGYDVNNLKCVGEMTYKQMSDDVLKRYEKFSLDKLDKTKCYSIGVHHNKFHPFNIEKVKAYKLNKASDLSLHDRYAAWFIQSVKLSDFGKGENVEGDLINYNDDIGLPFQEEIDISKTPFSKLVKTANEEYDDLAGVEKISYGYIIRLNNICFVINSKIMRSIRSLLYVKKFNKLNSRFEKHVYMCVYTFLENDKNSISELKKLFPYYEDIMKRIETSIDDLIRRIIRINNNIRAKKNSEIKSKLDESAQIVHSKLSESLTMKKYKNLEIKHFLNNVIKTPAYSEIVYDYMLICDS